MKANQLPEKTAMSLAVNRAMDDHRLAQLRFQSAYMTGQGGLDTKRSRAWCEYGFPDAIDFSMLYKLYKRMGVAHGGINKINARCWKTNPELVEGEEQDENKNETPWEKKANKILNARFWHQFATADLYRMVGRFSGLLLHIADGKGWTDDVDVGQGRKLEKVTPVWASALKPVDFDIDVNSQTYGQPKFWQYTEAAVADGSPGRVVKVHPDRIFIMGDWRTGAIGMLEPAYNAFVSLEKVEGGSGESFLKNAARQVSVSFDKDINFRDIAAVYGVSVEELQQQFNEAAREINRGNDSMLITQGASVSPLTQAVSDPQPTYSVNLQTAGAALDIPTKILVGMQTGERASTEDENYFSARCQSRRVKELSFDIEDCTRQLMRLKIIDPIEEIFVSWDDLAEQTDKDKLDKSEKMSNINDKSTSAGGQPIFTDKEIRVAAGYEPEKEQETVKPLPDTEPTEVPIVESTETE